MEKRPMVTILCTAFNHEKYIRKTLESFVGQQASFSFEVIVHDDASTDSTAKIIREFEEKYPNIIRAIYQSENQYSKRVSIYENFLVPKIRGKYVAFCEGDDYFFDMQKLSKQVNVLENNDGCYFSVHKVECIAEDGSILDEYIPNFEISSGLYSSKDFMSFLRSSWPFQFSSFMITAKKYIEYVSNRPIFAKESPVGDEAILLYFGSLGNTFYYNEVMSRYRRFSQNSWTSRQKKRSIETLLVYYEKKLKSLDLFNEYTNGRFADICECRKFYINLEKINYVRDENLIREIKTAYSNSEYLKKSLSTMFKIKMYIKIYLPYVVLAWRCFRNISIKHGK